MEEFIDSFFLWRDAMIVGALAGAVCGFLGVYVVIRRIIFMSAMLAQVSSTGVVLAFYIQSISLIGIFSSLINPFILSLVATSAIIVFFALKTSFIRISQEGLIGLIYLFTSALLVLMGSLITHEAHEVSDILFGSAVFVDPKDVYVVIGITLLTLLIHLWLHKEFIFVSFDPNLAKMFRYPVKMLNALLLLNISIVIAVLTQSLGALPVFGLTVLPPLTSLMLTERLKLAFMLSITMGVCSAVLGYFFSFVFSLPTGASITACASLFFLIAAASEKLRSSIHNH